MSVPSPFEFVLLTLAAYRVWRLLAEDTITARPRAWFVGGRKVAKPGRFMWLECPWCLGFWVGLGWTGAWWAWPHATTVAAVPFAISALVGLLALLEARLDEP